MASILVSPLAISNPIAVAVDDIVAVWSFGAFRVYQRGNYTNAPDVDSLLSDTPANSAPYASAAFTAASEVYIDAYGGQPVFYEVGTAAVVKVANALVGVQSSPVALNATGAITSAAILGRIVTSTTAAAVAGTLPTGAVLEAASEWSVNESIDWVVINTGPNDFTVTAASGHTVVGGAGAALVVPTLTAVMCRTRKTAADTFVTYSAARAVS